MTCRNVGTPYILASHICSSRCGNIKIGRFKNTEFLLTGSNINSEKNSVTLLNNIYSIAEYASLRPPQTPTQETRGVRIFITRSQIHMCVCEGRMIFIQKRVKLSLFTPWRSTGEAEALLHPLLLPALAGDEWSASYPTRFTQDASAPSTPWIWNSSSL